MTNSNNDGNEVYKNIQKIVKNNKNKKIPQDLTNDDLALHIEFWMALEETLTEGQKSFFEEVIWRLRMMSDVEKVQENNNE